MTRGKAIAAGLAGIAALLGLVAVAQWSGLGKGYSLDDETPEEARALVP